MTRAADRTERARYRLRTALNILFPEQAGRRDVQVETAYGLPRDAPPAWFDPATLLATINMDVALAGEHPDRVDPLTPLGRLHHPVLIGLGSHEGAHARGTRWRAAAAADTPRRVLAAAALLEEPRIEAWQLRRRPGDLLFLRAASRHLHLAPRAGCADRAAADTWRAAAAALLVLGRVDGGVLAEHDAAPLMPLLEDTLGPRLLGQLRALWRRAIRLRDGDGEGLLALAERWADLLPDGAEGSGGDGDRAAPACGTAQRDGDSAPPPDAEGDQPDTNGDAIGAAVAAVLEAVSDQAGREADAAARGLAGERTAAEAKIFGYGSTGHVGSVLAAPRSPVASEIAAANRLAARLRAAQFRERATTLESSITPPGRLNGRDALAYAAQRSLGLPPTAAPFRRTVHRHSEQPPLRVGIGVDVSGSMTWATGPMASAAWIIAQAVSRVDGRSATLAFGARLTPIVRPGERPAHVTQFRAADGTEEFTAALLALDGALTLTHGCGARLLVLVSDGHYREDQLRTGHAALGRIIDAGVGVLWLDLKGDAQTPHGITAVPVSQPAAAIDAIATAAIASLSAG